MLSFIYCSRNLPVFVRQSRHFLASSSAVCKSYALDGKGWDVLSGKTTRIGCASGFWGDSPSAGLDCKLHIILTYKYCSIDQFETLKICKGILFQGELLHKMQNQSINLISYLTVGLSN